MREAGRVPHEWCKIDGEVETAIFRLRKRQHASRRNEGGCAHHNAECAGLVSGVRLGRGVARMLRHLLQEQQGLVTLGNGQKRDSRQRDRANRPLAEKRPILE